MVLRILKFVLCECVFFFAHEQFQDYNVRKMENNKIFPINDTQMSFCMKIQKL